MKKRKQYIIDKEFQLKKSLTIVGFVSVIIAVVIIIAGSLITINNKKIRVNSIKIIQNTKNIRNNIELQQNNLIEYTLLPPGSGNRKKGDLIADYNYGMDILNKSIKSNNDMLLFNDEIAGVNTWLLILIIAVTVIGISVLFIQLIRETHRISGPVFLMKRHIKEILEGQTPDMRNLRQKDDLKELYDLFKKMANRFIELEKKSSG